MLEVAHEEGGIGLIAEGGTTYVYPYAPSITPNGKIVEWRNGKCEVVQEERQHYCPEVASKEDGSTLN